MEALTRLKLPPKIKALVESIYTDPKFRVKTNEGASEWKQQNNGIRQGCPLSPYLFLLVMHVLFWDIDMYTDGKLIPHTMDGTTFSRILYADDTLIVADNPKKLSYLLGLIETESEYYNMKLNYSKCEAISMNTSKSFKFKNGQIVPKKESATYLGAVFRSDAHIKHEIDKRITESKRTL